MKKHIFIILGILIGLITTTVTAQGDTQSTDSDANQGISAETIAAHPRPDVIQISTDPSLVNDRIYRRVDGEVNWHEGPDGPVTNTLANGFNFVTVTQFLNGWAEVSPGRWMPESSLLNNVPVSNFAGVLLPEDGLPYTMAWVLVNSYGSSTPGGEENTENPLLLRYTKVYIYDSVDVDGWRWYQVGDGQWIQQTKVAKVLPLERPAEVDTERWVSVDLYEQVAIAYEGETPVFATLIASGLPPWNTNEGLFHIYVRYERTIMSGAEGQPDFYYLEEVPWTMYFDNDIALHGAYWHDGFGYRRSHGCVNMTITDAHWMYTFTSTEFDFETPGDAGASVLVYSSDDYR